jgi:hypothetical protein
MKKILLTLFVLGVISCQPAKEKKQNQIWSLVVGVVPLMIMQWSL